MIQNLENFINLDSLQSSDGHCTQHPKRRIGLASSVMTSLNRVWKDQRLTLTTKLRVYQETTSWSIPRLLDRTSPVELWRHAVRRGHGAGATLRTSPATR